MWIGRKEAKKAGRMAGKQSRKQSLMNDVSSHNFSFVLLFSAAVQMSSITLHSNIT